MPIKKLPPHLRPREKALIYGVKKLTDIELVAIVIRNGTKECDALGIAKILLENYGDLQRLISAPLCDLQNQKGLGTIKAIELAVVGEIVNRANDQNSLSDIILSPAQIVSKLIKHPNLSLAQESLFVLLTTRSGNLLHLKQLYVGTKSSMNVDPHEVVSLAIKFGASHLWCAHNHPSGSVNASAADKSFTCFLQDLLSPFKIKMQGHIVFNEKGNFTVM